nr:DctP family TRAP transporter solute-binding subunit [uncultured Desulfobacter sp.]
MMMNAKYKVGMISISCWLAMAVLWISAAVAGPVQLKLGFVTAANEKDPYFITADKFSKLVSEYTQNRYEIKLFGSSQLGNDTALVKNLSMGTIDFGVVTNAPVGSFINPFMVLDLPFMFPSATVAHEVLDGPAGKMLLEKLSKLSIKGLAFSEGGFRHMINNVRPVNTPADLKSVKYRVMKTPVYIGMFKSLGANAVPMQWGEVFTAVQQKVVDGLEIPIPVIYANKYYEVTKYLSLTGHTYSPLVLMASERTWKKIAPEDQELFQKAAQEAAVYERNVIAGIIRDYLENLAKEGMVVNQIADKTPFQDGVKPMYKEFESKIGADVLNTFLAARDKAAQ